MKSDQQLDLINHGDARIAEAWRAAAETARQQFPHDTARHTYYTEQAERLERSAEAQNG